VFVPTKSLATGAIHSRVLFFSALLRTWHAAYWKNVQKTAHAVGVHSTNDIMND